MSETRNETLSEKRAREKKEADAAKAEKLAKEFLESGPEGPKAEETKPEVKKAPVSSGQDEDEFEPVDLGNFTFWEFEENPVFVGTWTGKLNMKDVGEDSPHYNEHNFDGLEFRDSRNALVILPNSYYLRKYFHEEEAETGVRYRITFIRKDKLQGGKSVSVFTIDKAKKKA